MSRIAFLATFLTGALDTGADLSRLRVQGSEFRVQSSRFRVQVPGFGFEDAGLCRVEV